MVDFIPFFKLVPIFAIALISPGPDFFMVSSLALSRGRTAGVQAAAGIALGNLIWSTLCLFGLGYLLADLHGLMLVVKMMGGAYLLYLAYQLWKSSLKPQAAAVAPPQGWRKRHPLMIGLGTNMTNPKALVFFTSIFVLVMPQHASAATQVALLATVGLMSVGWFGFVSFCLSVPAMRKVYLSWTVWIDRICGACLAFFGARLFLSFRD